MMRAKLLLVLAIVLCFGITVAHAGESQATDYSKPEHWLALPVVIDKKVDVFYLYPTSWKKVAPDEPNICRIDNPTMLAGAKVSYGKQATAFEPVGNVYAPYYRQIDLSPVDREKRVGGIPTQDAAQAFDYYIKHYNHGRPFILAGHSQGANILSNLLAGYLKDRPEVYARMVAAYVIGYSVTGPYLAANPHLKFAEGPDDTGVIISYNTEAPDVAAGTNPVTLPAGIAINPITWTRDETLAPAAENMGSIMPVDGVFVPVMNYADARVDKTKGVVICSTADEGKLSPPLAELRGVYHSYDYPFYYYNIRQNAANRVEHFLNKR